jgi:hypothetical protein
MHWRFYVTFKSCFTFLFSSTSFLLVCLSFSHSLDSRPHLETSFFSRVGPLSVTRRTTSHTVVLCCDKFNNSFHFINFYSLLGHPPNHDMAAALSSAGIRASSCTFFGCNRRNTRCRSTTIGYLDNHNMHPATVGSSIFGFLWKNTYGAKEKWYAKPLVYTPTGGNQTQLVFLASSMNVIRTVDAVTGALINNRTVQPPFLQSDIGCTDIPDYIGIIGTPIIDPNTDTVYFFSKGYKDGASSGGVANGIYKFYAVDINTLLDRPGFPVLIDGHNADSDPTRYFIGGTGM